MKTRYHIEITQQALSGYFSTHALNDVIKANIQQDKIIYMLGHDHFHVDGNAFNESFEYIAKQEEMVLDGIEGFNVSSARSALGRMLHTWQDFYSHSNYVQLWLAKVGNTSPQDIVYDDEVILHHPDLVSGKNYGLMELFALIPIISHLIIPLMPQDSHAQMNLDGPNAGPLFQFAYWAAFKRTVSIFNGIMLQLNAKDISQKQISQFLGK